MFFYSLPHLQSNLIRPMEVQGELSVPSVALLYIVLVASSYFHNDSYFEMVSSIGAVQTGLLNAIRAVLVFGLSNLAFCSRDSHQCYSAAKGIATLLVVTGILLFSYGKSKQGGNKSDMLQMYPLVDGKAKQTPLLGPSDPHLSDFNLHALE